jgi:hypothetical protein
MRILLFGLVALMGLAVCGTAVAQTPQPTIPGYMLNGVFTPCGSAGCGSGGGGGSTTPIAPNATTSLSTSKVLKASAGNLYSWSVTSSTPAGFVLILDLAADPGNGASVTPKYCYPLAANSYNSGTFAGGPPGAFANGVTIVFSTTGCFTETQSATAFITGQAF